MIRSAIKDGQGSHGTKQTLKKEITCEHEIMRRREKKRNAK